MRHLVERSSWMVVVMAVSSAALLTTGCAELGVSRTARQADSVHLKPVQFDDIPVPFGFTLVDYANRSLTYEVPGMRVGKLTYRADRQPSIERVTNFYLTNMPRHHGWTLVTPPSPEAGSGDMTFVKGDASCDVNVYQQGDYTIAEVTVNTSHES